MNKKLWALTLILALLVSMIAGCTGADPATDAGTDAGTDAPSADAGDSGSVEPAADAADISGTIDVWHYWDGQLTIDAALEMGDKIMAKYPGLTVNTTYVPREELLKQYTMGAVSGELPDVGMMDNPEMAAFIEMGICLDITDQFNAWDEKDYFYEGPMNSAMKDGRVYGLPQNSNCLEVFYDVDVFEEAGVEIPATWDELVAVCAELNEQYPDKYPFAFSANNNEEGTFHFIPFLISAGANIDDLGSAGAVKAMTYWKDLVDAGYTPKDVIGWGQTELNSQFMSGNVIMQLNGPWNIAILEDEAPDKNWGVFLVPRDEKYASVLGGENFAITTAADPELGWAYLSELCNGKNIAEFCATVGKFAPRSDSGEYSDVWDTDPALAVFDEGMQYAMPRGPHPRWNEFSGVISNAIQEVLTGAKTPEDAMTDAQEAGSAIMAE